MTLLRRTRIWAPAGILLFGLILHLWRLTDVPPGLDEDAAANGWRAVQWLRGGGLPFWNGRNGATEPLMVLLQTATTLLWGPSIFALRVVSAVALALAGVALYALMGEIGRSFPATVQRWGARLAAVAMLSSPAMLELGRTGLRATLLPLGIGLFAWLLLVALRRGEWRWYAASGLCLGVVGYTYLAARLLPVAVGLFLLVHFATAYRDPVYRDPVRDPVRDPEARRRLVGGVALLIGGAALVLLPQVIFFFQHPHAFWARAGAVTLAQNPLAQEVGYGGVLARKLIYMVRLFGLEWWGQYNQGGRPLLVWPAFVGFLAVWPLVWRARRVPGVQLLVILLPIMLLPDLLGGDRLEPHSLRVIGALLPAFGLAGLGLAWLIARLAQLAQRASGFQAQRVAAALGGALLLLVGGWGAADWLFWVQPRLAQSDYAWYAREDVALAQWINAQSAPVLVPVYELSRPNLVYLTADRAGEPRGALAAPQHLQPDSALSHAVTGAVPDGIGWQPALAAHMADPNAQAWLVQMVEPVRPRVEASSYRYDPAALVLLHGGTSWIMPPLVTGSARAASDGCRKQAIIRVADHVDGRNGERPVAQACRVALADLSWRVLPAFRVADPNAGVGVAAPPGYVFDGSLHLIDAWTDLNERVADATGEDAGEKVIPVHAIWQAQAPRAENPQRRMFVHIVADPAGGTATRVAGEDFMPAYGLYGTRMWQPGSAIPLRQLVPVPPDLPPGRYWLDVGLYDPLSGARSPVMTAAETTAETTAGAPVEQARFGPLKIPMPPPAADFGGTPVAVAMGDELRLDAYRVEIADGELRVRLRVTALAPPQADYTFFVHLVKASDDSTAADDTRDETQGEIVAQHDTQPHDGRYPTGIWTPGEVVDVTLRTPLPAQVAETQGGLDAYRLWLGAYEWQPATQTALRLPLRAVSATDATPLITPQIRDDRVRLPLPALP